MSAEIPDLCVHCSQAPARHGEQGACLAAGYYGNKYQPPTETPAPSDAEVEALDIARWWCEFDGPAYPSGAQVAEAMLASDWFAALLARHAAEVQAARAAALQEAADFWDDPANAEYLKSLAAERYRAGGPSMPAIYLRDRADGEAKA